MNDIKINASQNKDPMQIEEYDVVRLKNGSEGTIVFVYSPHNFCFEYEKDGEWNLIDIESNDIETILQKDGVLK